MNMPRGAHIVAVREVTYRHFTTAVYGYPNRCVSHRRTATVTIMWFPACEVIADEPAMYVIDVNGRRYSDAPIDALIAEAMCDLEDESFKAAATREAVAA